MAKRPTRRKAGRSKVGSFNMGPEDIQCTMFTQWLEMQKLKFTHIPNENIYSFMDRGLAQYLGGKAKKIGVRAGLPDYVILTPRGVLWVEMKPPSSKPKSGESPLINWKPGQKTKGGLGIAQKDWILAINETPSTQAEVCYGAEEAIAFVSRILQMQT